jgi:hypothetical protein
MKIYQRYEGNNTGAEPTLLGEGSDYNCPYTSPDLRFLSP